MCFVFKSVGRPEYQIIGFETVEGVLLHKYLMYVIY